MQTERVRCPLPRRTWALQVTNHVPVEAATAAAAAAAAENPSIPTTLTRHPSDKISPKMAAQGRTRNELHHPLV